MSKPKHKLPEGWKEWRIGDIAKIQVARDLNRKAYSKCETPTHVYPVYSNAIEKSGLYGFYDFEEYPGNSVTVIGRGELGVAFPRKGGFGAIGRLIVVSPAGDESFDARYLADYINFKLRIFKEKSGVPQLTGVSFGGYKVVLPPYETQKQMADILEAWDTAIEKIDALVAAKERMFGRLLQKLVDNSPESSSWGRMPLGEVGNISSAGVDKKVVEGEKPVRLLNYLDVFHQDKIYSGGMKHWVTAPQQKIEKCSVLKGDIFFTPSSETRGDIGFSAVAMENMQDVVYSYHIIRLRPKIEIDLLYSAYAFKGLSFYRQVTKFADGSGQRYVVSQGNFRKVQVAIPPIEEQKRIACILDTAPSEINTLKSLVECYRTQKRGLMQKLLTGEWHT